MKKLIHSVCFTLLCLLLAGCGASFQCNIIPFPASCISRPGHFRLSSKTSLSFSGDLSSFSGSLHSRIAERCGILCDNDIAHGNIIFLKYETNPSAVPESYTLSVSRDSVIIAASHEAGLFYGTQTFLQMLPGTPEKTARLSCLEIKDSPRFAWRGLNLDCSRHFMEKDFILRYLDLMAYYKLNTFHWHLTDDQAWRLEIKKYPLLTQIGSFRKNKDGNCEGGYYSQEDVKEIVNYAAERHIQVVPEIEMPGHCTAALAAYPQFSCTGGPFEVQNRFGVHKDVFCAGNDSTFDFLEDILEEVMALFPAPFIHIGGDEVPRDRWNNCEKCQERIRSEHLADSDELQAYFVKRIEKFIRAHNKHMIGWDEILDGGIDTSATIQCWRRESIGQKAAEFGHSLIMSPVHHTYFNSSEVRIDLRKAYDFPVIPHDLSSEYHARIRGAECCLWTEYTPQKMVDYRLFPRLTAFSEAVWTPVDKRDFSRYYLSLQEHYDYLRAARDVRPGPEAQPVSLCADVDTLSGKYYLSCSPGMADLQCRYSFKDTVVTLRDPLFSDTLAFSHDGRIHVQAFQGKFPYGRTEHRHFENHLARLKLADLIGNYHRRFAASGKFALVDGILGSDYFKDGIWQGYEGDDIIAVLDLCEETELHHISCGFLQRQNSWIFMPAAMDIQISDDGIQYEHVTTLYPDIKPRAEGLITTRLSFEPQNLAGRFVRIHIHSLGICPEWHHGAGGKAWIFADEIIVR